MEFVHKVEEIFNQLSGRPIVLICGQNKTEFGSKEEEKFVSFYSLMSSVKFHMHSYVFTSNVFIFVYFHS